LIRISNPPVLTTSLAGVIPVNNLYDKKEEILASLNETQTMPQLPHVATKTN